METRQIPTQLLTPEAAKAAGFKTFNNNPQLCVELPDGATTISVRLSNGKTVTFAFVPYENGGTPQCVDVETGVGAEPFPQQDVICFTKGGTAFRSKAEKPVTLTTVLVG